MEWKSLCGSGIFQVIRNWRNMWNYSVIPALRSMELIPGPGIRMERHPYGTIVCLAQESGTSGISAGMSSSDDDPGNFKLYLGDDGKIHCSSGYANVSGTLTSFAAIPVAACDCPNTSAPVWLTRSTGGVYALSTTPPEYPSLGYLLGYVKYRNGTYEKLISFNSMPTFLVTAACPWHAVIPPTE